MSEAKSAAITAFATIVAAVITAAATVAAVWIAQRDDPAAQNRPALPVQGAGSSPTAHATPASAEPTRTPATQLEGDYVWVWQNFDPRPSEATMRIRKNPKGSFYIHTKGVYERGYGLTATINSYGELTNDGQSWLLSVDSSDNSDFLTNGSVQAYISFDGSTLDVRVGGMQARWRRQ